jgi:hypothetical protein
MTNRERILDITYSDKAQRRERIIAHLDRPHYLQAEGDIVNIVVPAKNQDLKTTLCAHYDIYPGSKGYNDNSSGVVALLNIHELLPDDVEIVFTDFEEFGGRGCQLYLESVDYLPSQAINVDVVGVGNRMFYESYAGGITASILENMEHYRDIPFSDSYIFREFGVPNILLLAGESKQNLLQKIFEAQHCGPRDGDIMHISEEMIDLAGTTILNLLNARESF